MTFKLNHQYVAFLYLLGVSIFYALQIIVQKAAFNNGAEAIPFIFSRSIIVVIISLGFFFPLMKESIQESKSKLGLWLIALTSAAGIFMFILGQKFTSAMNAGFLVRLTPLFVPIFMFLMLKEFPSKQEIVAMIVMLIGAFLLTTNGKLIIPNLGDILIIIVAIVVAFQNVLAKFLMRNIKRDVVIFFRICISSLLLILFIPFISRASLTQPLMNYSLFVLSAAIFYFLAVICHYRAINLVGPFITTLFFLLGSVFSAALAFFALKETLTLIQILGAVGILIGGVLVSRKIKEI